MKESEDDRVLNAIIIASVIGIVIVAGLIICYPKPTEDFTAIYFGNYTKQPVNGTVYFNYTIENHENRGMTYDVAYVVDNATISNEPVAVADGGNITLQKSVAVNASRVNKVGVLLNTSEEIHFWTTI